jgi:hypothetical protein
MCILPAKYTQLRPKLSSGSSSAGIDGPESADVFAGGLHGCKSEPKYGFMRFACLVRLGSCLKNDEFMVVI